MEMTIIVKGQVVLPKTLRDSLHLKTGDKIVFEKLKNGSCLLRPKTLEVQTLKVCVRYKGAAKTLDDMDNAISENAGR